MDFILTYLVPLLIPALLGLAVQPFMQGIKKLSTWVDSLPAYGKQLIVGVLAIGATKLSTLLGVTLDPNVMAWDGEVVRVVLTAVVAFVTHKFIKPPA